MKLKVFDYLWHIPHQFDMMYALQDDCDFTFALNVKAQWDTGKRPLPPNLKFVTHYEPGKYDIALLHVDQQVVDPHDVKRMIYTDFNRHITGIPKIVINHGSPVLPTWFDKLFPDNEEAGAAFCRNEVKKLIGNNFMIVNSHTAASEKEWGFGHPVIHGINPMDWYDLPKEPRVFTAISSGGFDKYYNRKNLDAVAAILSESVGYVLNHTRVNINTHTSPEDYKRYLGASLLYFDPSFRTPMNRARTEAFLSGCCVIQVEGAHDLDRWAVNGENIILVPNDPFEIASIIADMIENRYEEAIRIGRKAKEMAMKEFSVERYRTDWLRAFEMAISKHESEAIDYAKL